MNSSNTLQASNTTNFLLTNSQDNQAYDEYSFYYNTSGAGSLSDFRINSLFWMELRFNASDALTDAKEVRTCYFHTYVSSAAADYIILPQHAYVGNKLKTNTTHIIEYSPTVFLNSIINQGQQVLFVAIIILNNNGATLPTSLWAGLSFSYSHVYRDMVMIGFYQTGTVNITDSFSLFAHAPYADISSNIGGKENIVKVSSRQRVGCSLVLFTRPFQTGDTYGDETLTKKINQDYCLALYTLSPSNDQQVQAKSIHNYLFSFNPDLNLCEWRMVFFLSIAVLLMLLH